MKQKRPHSFHIPVMGIGFTINTPLKVSHLGIDSVISLVDDELIEKMRKLYCETFQLPYSEIKKSVSDFRAKRITEYLNMIYDRVEINFENLKKNGFEGKDLIKYIDMLPMYSELKKSFLHFSTTLPSKKQLYDWLNQHLVKGSIDVNIMTKVDKENFIEGEKLPSIYNDAHAALRGYANSKLNSAVVLSAGMNPRLFSYMQEFKDFYPDQNNIIKKKIILKVSDYRSALIQGQFLAKKGLWVSEFRIESGLNCGGHAFATEGLLMGPILEEFKINREILTQNMFKLYTKALVSKKRYTPSTPLPIRVSAQGGVGNHQEHHFLINEYQLDSIGWGSPFLLVPEATTVDKDTRDSLSKAKEKDIYLSDISPLGVPFQNLKGNTKDLEKELNIEKGRPGSSCPRKYVCLDKEFSPEGLCTASRQYQFLKLKQLDTMNLSNTNYTKQYNKITAKSCTCVGLGTSALIANNLDTKVEGSGVSICPGPNMAYFDKEVSLETMVQHIYGKTSILANENRPHVFIKESRLYLKHLKEKIQEISLEEDKKTIKSLEKFRTNMLSAIDYYRELFQSSEFRKGTIKKVYTDLDKLQTELAVLNLYVIV